MSQAASKEDFGLKILLRDHFKATLDVKKMLSGQVYLCLCAKNNKCSLLFLFSPFPDTQVAQGNQIWPSLPFVGSPPMLCVLLKLKYKAEESWKTPFLQK